MTNSLHTTPDELNNCGCGEGIVVQTPAAIDNRPGLPTIRFRAGVHSQFLSTLLASLSSAKYPALQNLRTRDNSDPTIALLDAFACMADVLTFYAERIAGESYLRTATERRSVLELARAIGYELAPGASAQVLLSFTVEGGRGAPGTAVISRGTRVQSIPGPGQKPQTFETSQEFAGRAAWNELRPRQRSAPASAEVIPNASELYLAGTAANLRLGDVLVLSSGTTAQAKRIVEVAVDREKNHTLVRFEATSETMSARMAGTPFADIGLTAISVKPGVQMTNENLDALFLRQGVSEKEMYARIHFFGWNASKVESHLNSLPKATLFPPDAGVFAMRTRASFFGHNAPNWSSLPPTDSTTKPGYPDDWDNLKNDRGRASGPSRIWQNSQGADLNPPRNDTADPQLDVLIERPLPEVVAGSWLVLEAENSALIPLRVGRNSELSRADFGMSAKCARLNLKNADGLTDPVRDPAWTTRGTTAHVQSECLEVIGSPITTDLTQGLTELELDRMVASLFDGQLLAIRGENASLSGTIQREIVIVGSVNHTDVTTVTLKEGLRHSYKRSTVTLNANVVPATHGETTQEVLGSGDAGRSFQTFFLRQKPLTCTFPPGAGTRESSLEIRVDDVRWREVSTFFGSGPKDHVYVVRESDDGTTHVQFGDGRQGARLPTGRENVRATYRKGIGLEGIVEADQLSLLLTQPLGVKGVTNLLAPQGAEDPQSLEDARVNIPRAVLTLDRIVSLQDYEDFARDFPGVAKAHASWIWNGQTRGVLLTLLGPNGRLISDTGQPADPLRKAITTRGISRVPIRIVSRPPSLFAVRGVVRVEPDRLAIRVEAAVMASLRAAFSFSAREFGQGVSRSEVIAVVQNVPGVAIVQINGFVKTSLSSDGTATETEKDSTASGDRSDFLAAGIPANGVDSLLAEPAELLILDESSLSKLEVKQ